MMRHIALLTFVLVLSGCFGGGSEVPQDNFYRLTDITSAKQLTSPFEVVAVATLKSDALHRERAILYSDVKQPLNIKRYHYHHWTQVPNELVQDHLIEYLRKAEFAPRMVRYGEVVNIGRDQFAFSIFTGTKNSINFIPCGPFCSHVGIYFPVPV